MEGNLEEPLCEANEQDVPVPTTLRTNRRLKVALGMVVLLVAIVLGCGLVYLAMNGAFDSVVRDVRIVDGNVIEPNTKLSFPLNKATMAVSGQERPQRLIGVFLKVRHVPELQASVHVFVLALYVDLKDGRRELSPFRGTRGVPDAHQSPREFQNFVDVMSSGRMSITGEYRMVMTTPGSRMMDSWLGSLVDLWTSYGLEQARIDKLRQCFIGWFARRGFKNHDVDILEWNNNNNNNRHPPHATWAQSNEQVLKPVCADPMFGRAFISHELIENGNLAVDLLPTLWNH